ncbi:MAG TPA: hypothetical protein VFV98_13555 [Vicinamibacterales bacterium]|nr:hypothetical protein [Vicinamibacterales bacterium]
MPIRAAARVCAAAAALALFLVVDGFSKFLPLPRRVDPDYYFIWPAAGVIWTCVAASVVAVVALWVGVRLAASGRADDVRVAARDARWLMPLVWAAPLALGVVAALPGVGSRAAPLAYFLYDLRWCWIALIALAVVLNLILLIFPRKQATDSAFQVPRVPDVPRVPVVLAEALVFSLVAIWAIGTTPLLRFTGGIHGDEPKYIRYIETLYQGQGFDIDAKKPMADYRADADSRLLANIGLAAAAVGSDTRELVDDLGSFARDPRGFRWNRATAQPNWFLTGKHGTAYQVHTPGLSFLLLPGYYIDRHFLSVEPGYQGEFPAELVMTNVMMLTFYALAAAALFRLLLAATADVRWSAAGAVLAMITLPSTSFAFQLYPETPAALIVLSVVLFLCFGGGTPTSWLAATAAGAATSYLTWLHPRFLLLWLVLVVLGTVNLEPRQRRDFLAGAAVVMFSFCAFAYHLTGSWLPTAMYDADPESNAFVLSIIPVQMVANLLDRVWGIVPHAPILLAVPAGVIAVWRRRRRDAVAVVTIVIALLFTTASHGLGAAGATPGRHLMAIVPLMFWPLTVLAIDVWPSLPRRAALIVLAVLSVETAWTYNLVHEKAVGRFVGESASGWRLNLAFPWMHTRIWEDSSANFGVLLAIIALVLVGTWWLTRSAAPEAAAVPPLARPQFVAVGVFVAIVASTALTAAGRDRTSADYLPPAAEAHHRIASTLVDVERCRGCRTSAPGRVDWTSLQPNPIAGLAIDSRIEGREAHVIVHLTEADTPLSPAEVSPFARIVLDYGDGTRPETVGVVGSGEVAHRYASAGRYVVTATVGLPTGRSRLERLTVIIP